MSGLVATRNTCFALISSIEDDFRTLCTALGDPNDLLPPDVLETSRKRRQFDLRMEAESREASQLDLLPYVDFADLAKAIDAKIATRQEPYRTWLNSTSKRLLSLTATRNRVCHSRPLETEDLPSLVDFADFLLDPVTPFPFATIRQTRARLSQEPGFVLTLQIPTYWAEKSKVHHNLPIPEFDDTGFVGRHGDRLSVLKLLKSHYPVVTIVGEGGIGKTALALRCLYDLLDDVSGYDAIIWVSLKTSALTSTGVRQLGGAITSTLGLLSELVKQLGVESTERTQEQYIDEIIEYLNLYRILIAIDNLETVSVGPLRDLLLRVPPTSKVLLTSRIGLGEFEARYPLQGLEEKAAITLVRAHAKVLGIPSLQKLDDGNLKGYCRKLFFSPLLLKWFVSSVGRGMDANSLVNRGGESFSAALAYCFQNLYERLGEAEQRVIACLACARKPLTSAELHFLMPNLSLLELEVALIALHNSSIVNRSKKGADAFEYALSESTNAFVDRYAPPEPHFFKEIQSRLRDLRVVLTQENILEGRYEYDPFFVRSGEGRDDRICATYLRRALDSLKRGDLAGARRELEESLRLTPQNGEVWRIAALVEQSAGDHYKAYQYFENAADHAPQSRIARYCFGMFLMQDMDELEGALAQFESALKLDHNNATLLTAKAMALNRCGKFSEASAIHENLLTGIATRERRWRLTGVDQAADCYRRWGFRAWEQKEYEASKSHFKRALCIIRESAERGDLDEKILERTARILSESLGRRELTESDVPFVEYLLVSAERICEFANGRSIPVMHHGRYAMRNLENTPGLKKRLMDLDRSFADVEAIEVTLTGPACEAGLEQDGRRIGEVHNLQENFGFLVEKDGARWFFHRNFLLPELRWEALTPGMTVTFALGHNGKGECAVDVGPLRSRQTSQ